MERIFKFIIVWKMQITNRDKFIINIADYFTDLCGSFITAVSAGITVKATEIYYIAILLILVDYQMTTPIVDMQFIVI